MNKRKLEYSHGFSLMEVMVSLAIMGIVMAGILPAFAFQMKMNTRAELRTAALEAGQRMVDQLRFISPTAMPSSGAGTAETFAVDGKTFVVTPYYCLRSQFCTSAWDRHITVRVVYNGTNVYETETVFTKFQ